MLSLRSSRLVLSEIIVKYILGSDRIPLALLRLLSKHEIFVFGIRKCLISQVSKIALKWERNKISGGRTFYTSIREKYAAMMETGSLSHPYGVVLARA
jgi:hypothetical protein